MNPTVARILRRLFWMLNKFFMVPVFRLGLGPIFGSPYGGYVMVIKNRGRLSGKLRYTPVNYAIEGGDIYCVAGFGKIAHWYKNLLADPEVELILPSGGLAASAERVPDQAERLETMRRIMINSGFAAFLFGGFNPITCSDERLRQVTEDYILLRFRPTGIGGGAWDQGGWGWLWLVAGMLALVWLWLR